MNVIMGLPRSGSTLLCNILAQNPSFYVEHTNMLPEMLHQMITLWSGDADIKGWLQQDQAATEQRLWRTAKAACDAWHNTDKVVFNKSRGWSLNLLALKHIYPDAKVIVTIRDPREIFASFERQHQKYPLLELGARNMLTRAQNMFSANGMIGSCLVGIEDIIYRKQEVFYVKYEDFVKYPNETMERLYCFIGQPSFEHDFDNITNTATDPDYLYLNKYPHRGDGKLEARPVTWPKVMNQQISSGIARGFPWFFEEFKYKA